MKVKYYYDSENLVSQNKDKKEINLVLLSSFGGIGLVWLSYICDLIKHSILTLWKTACWFVKLKI
jgi:hypothetical protein